MINPFRRGVTILLFLASAASAQTWELFAPATSGLPLDSIRDIRSNLVVGKNSKAAPYLIYVLHARGISRFKGLWEYFPDTFGAEDDAGINTVIYFDPNGGLWIGRSNGIHFVSSESLDSLDPQAQNWAKKIFPDTLLYNKPPVVSAIHRDRNGVLWVGTDNCGLIRFAPQFTYRSTRLMPTRRTATHAFSTISKITDIVEDSSSLWIATFDGLFRINYAGEEMAHFLGDQWVPKAYVDTDKRIWAATQNGLFLAASQREPQFQQVLTPQSVTDSTNAPFFMTALVQDFNGAMWAASTTQIYRYQKAAYRNPSSFSPEVFSRQNGWPSEVQGLIRFAADRTGFVWAASHLEGILRYNMLWESIDLIKNKDITLQSNDVNALSWNPSDSSLYIGTQNGVAKRDKLGHWQKIDAAGCTEVSAFFHDPARFSLLSTLGCWNSRLVGYNGKISRPIACAQCPDLDNGYHAFVKLPNDTLWLAGEFDLWSTRIDSIQQTANLTRITQALKFSSGRFNCFLRQQFRDTTFIWIGTATQGLARYNTVTRRIDRLPFVGNFAAQKVSSLHLDATNTLWLGTSLGLTRLEAPFNLQSPRWRDFNDGDPSNEPEGQFVFSAANGDIWFDARDGVGRYNTEAGVTYFPRLNGPLVKDINLGIAVRDEDKKDSFWFGTAQGLTVFHGDRIPPVTRITLSPQNFSEKAPNVIRLASNTLLVDYEAGDNFTASSQLYFQTALMRMNDTDPTSEKISWEPNFTQNRRQFLTFPEAGVYHFYVRARDQSGNLDPTPSYLIIIADTDPPSVVVTAPPRSLNAATWVPGNVTIRGSVTDLDLAAYRVELIESNGDIVPIAKREREGAGKVLTEIRDAVLAIYDISRYHEQMLRIIVTAEDTLRHFRRDTVTVRIDSLPPAFQVVRPENFTQLHLTVADALVSFRFREQHHNSTISYRELGETEFSTRKLKNVQGDSLGEARIAIRNELGEHALEFTFRDLAGNFAKDTLTFTRVVLASGNRSIVSQSNDGLVEVHIPPGDTALTVLISPVERDEYGGANSLAPQSRAYLIEPSTDFGRRATLSFRLAVDYDSLAIFRFDEGKSSWRHIGGKRDTLSGENWLRATITQGSVYLVGREPGVGITGETFPSGNVTCLPRLFSPGRSVIAEFTEVIFSLARLSPVTIHIFNTAGRRVKTLAENEITLPGRHAMRWDGSGDNDGRLRSGIYIVVVQTNAFTETKSVIIQN